MTPWKLKALGLLVTAFLASNVECGLNSSVSVSMSASVSASASSLPVSASVSASASSLPVSASGSLPVSASVGSGSGSGAGSGSGSGDVGDLVSSYHSTVISPTSTSAPLPSASSSPSPTVPNEMPTTEEAKKAAAVMVLEMSLSEWTPTKQAAFKQSIATAITAYCSSHSCAAKRIQRSALHKRSTQAVYTVNNIVILPGYPREVTVNGRTELEIQFYVAALSSGGSSPTIELLSPEVLVSAVAASQSTISQTIGVPISSMTLAENPSTTTLLIDTSEFLLLTVVPPAVAGGFVFIAIGFAVLLLMALWLHKRRKTAVRPVRTIHVEKA